MSGRGTRKDTGEHCREGLLEHGEGGADEAGLGFDDGSYCRRDVSLEVAAVERVLVRMMLVTQTLQVSISHLK